MENLSASNIRYLLMDVQYSGSTIDYKKFVIFLTIFVSFWKTL
jgi:hypothetical protein